MTEGDGTIRVGVLYASPSQLTQISTWGTAFRSLKISVEGVAEIERGGVDLYLLVLDPDSEREIVLEALVVAAQPTPLVALALRDDEAMAERAMAERAAMAGFAYFLVMSALDAAHLERALLFALQQRHMMESMRARESALAEARERERIQLANALHDGPLQDLIGARFLVGALAADATGEVQESLQSVIQAVRSLCSNLKPPALAPFGLEKAIRAHLQGFQTRYPGIAVTFDYDGSGADKHPPMPEWARYALFRIYQAAVANVAKHAQATEVQVRLRLDGKAVHLIVADDGQGFEVPSSWLDFARTEQCGLLMMQERVDALGGRMVVQSIPGSGTRIIVQAPAEQPHAPFIAPFVLPLPSHSTPPGTDRNG